MGVDFYFNPPPTPITYSIIYQAPNTGAKRSKSGTKEELEPFIKRLKKQGISFWVVEGIPIKNPSRKRWEELPAED